MTLSDQVRWQTGRQPVVEYCACHSLGGVWMMDVERWQRRLTKPTVAPVKRTRKNALVPVASSWGLSALVKTWYGVWKSMPRPKPAIKGYTTWGTTSDFSSKRFNNPESYQKIKHGQAYLRTFSYRNPTWRQVTQLRSSSFGHWCHESVVANTQRTKPPA